MTVEDVISKIQSARKIIGILNSDAITFHETAPGLEILDRDDIIDILEEYVYLLNNMRIAKQ